MQASIIKASSRGHIHPITSTIERVRSIFNDIGFTVALGPELEREFYNFDALNIPADHPSRDMQDTFWINESKRSRSEDKAEADLPGHKHLGGTLLTTQTSAVQVRYMENHKPPFKVLVPGKVFRNEATDATHETQFFQIEGLCVDKKVSLADLKGTIEYAFKKMFGGAAEIRFRPSFFPFVEPAVEVDVMWKGKWLEIMGAGMVHPNVFKAAGIDASQWQGFAFAFGLDRLVMAEYGIDDIRFLYSGDLRFVNQF